MYTCWSVSEPNLKDLLQVLIGRKMNHLVQSWNLLENEVAAG